MNPLKAFALQSIKVLSTLLIGALLLSSALAQNTVRSVGYSPFQNVILASDGNLYGWNSNGGQNGAGAIFRLSLTGAAQLLCSLPSSNDNYVAANVIEANDGNFYGITRGGGASNNGSIFQLTKSGVFTTIYSFTGNSDGARPSGGLIQGSDGNLYGTTAGSGLQPLGTIFKCTLGGTLTTLYGFYFQTGNSLPYGSSPQGSLLQDSSGNLYGIDTTSVFKLTPQGAISALATIPGDSYGGLILASDGNFYGTTHGGGTSSMGTVFQLTPSGTLTVLVSFNGTNGAGPQAPVIEGSDGNLYGTTFSGGANGMGTVFKVTKTGVLTTIVSFDGPNGNTPFCSLIQDSNGILYGTTISGGGATDALGTVFKLDPTTSLLTTIVTFSAPGADPRITTSPSSQVVTATQSASFSVVAAGTTPFTYQWQRLPSGGTVWMNLSDGGSYAGTATATLSVSSTTVAMSGDQFQCLVTNAIGSVTSGAASLTVNPGVPATITTQPVAQAVVIGQTASFSVVANGAPPPSYQWQKDGSNISGANSATFSISNVSEADIGSYSVIVSNAFGNQTSNSVDLLPVDSLPTAQTVAVGASASFSIVVPGPGPYTYQWQKDGVNISGATSSSFSIASASQSDQGNYSVIVTDTYGNVTTNPVALVVGTGVPAMPLWGFVVLPLLLFLTARRFLRVQPFA